MPSQSCKGASWDRTGQPGLSTLLLECPLPLANSGVSTGQMHCSAFRLAIPTEKPGSIPVIPWGQQEGPTAEHSVQ